MRANGGSGMAFWHWRRAAAMRLGNGRLTIASVVSYMLGDAQIL